MFNTKAIAQAASYAKEDSWRAWIPVKLLNSLAYCWAVWGREMNTSLSFCWQSFSFILLAKLFSSGVIRDLIFSLRSFHSGVCCMFPSPAKLILIKGAFQHGKITLHPRVGKYQSTSLNVGQTVWQNWVSVSQNYSLSLQTFKQISVASANSDVSVNVC